MTRFCELLCGSLSSCDVDQQWCSRDFSDEFSGSRRWSPVDSRGPRCSSGSLVFGLVYCAKLSAESFFFWWEQTTRTRSPHTFGFSESTSFQVRGVSHHERKQSVCVHSEFIRDTRALFSDMNTHMTSCFINLLTTKRSFGVFSLTRRLWSELINLVSTTIIFFHTGDIIASCWHWVFLINRMLSSKCFQRYNSWFSELVKCSFATGSHLNQLKH